MKVIIAGGGIAGQMLTGLLHRKGIQAMVLEKARSYSDVGFSMGLYPFSANTLIEIGAYEDYLGESIAINEYRLCNHEGEAIQSLSLRDTLKKINGEMRTLHRANLLNILMKGASATPPRMGTVISRMEQSDRQVTVVLSDGEEITADLVIGADGIHSDVRANIHTRTEWLDWGFTAFTWWTHPLDETRSNIHEFWGCGAMFGLYPIPDRINAVVSLPTPADLESMNQEALKAYLRENFREYPPLAQKALASLDHEKIFVWPMVDQRAPTWVKGASHWWVTQPPVFCQLLVSGLPMHLNQLKFLPMSSGEQTADPYHRRFPCGNNEQGPRLKQTTKPHENLRG